MTDIAALESSISSAIAAASDEAALEAVRVSSLGKSGSVSALLKTLGSMTPDERKVQGPADQRAERARHRSARGAAYHAGATPRSMRGSIPKRWT